MNQQVTLNQILSLSYPEGFHIMTEAEKGSLNVLEAGPGEVLYDPARHIMISIGWKVLGKVPAMLLSAKDAIKVTESQISGPMQAYGYQMHGFFSKKIGSEKAEGFSYSYKAQGIEMHGESYVVKYKKTFYYLQLYVREELKDESLALWEEILSSAGWN
jgi:hypothetical protein